MLEDKAIEGILKKNPGMKSLSLNICPLMGDESAKGISGLQALQELSLENCSIGSGMLSNPALYSMNLRSVSLACTGSVDDGAIQALSER